MICETEVKIALGDLGSVNEILKKCSKSFETINNKVYQCDEYFDTEDEFLKNQDFTVRLRTVNDDVFLAIKGPRMYIDGKVHERLELEFKVDDKENIYNQIKRHSLKSTTIIEKYRWTFKSGDAYISIDELPFIRNFIEIEGPYKSIRNVISLLELNEDNAIAKNYTELLEERFRNIGIPGRPNLRATFDLEKKWIQSQKT